MQIREPWFSFQDNKADYITAFSAIISIIICLCIGIYAFNSRLTNLIWLIQPIIFIVYNRVGETRKQEVFYSLEHLIYSLIAINAATVPLVFFPHYMIIGLGILIFCCMALPRVRAGTAVLSIFLTIYVLVVVFLFHLQLFNKTNYFAYLQQQSLSMCIATIVTIVTMCCFPAIKNEVPIELSENYQITRAVRLSISIMVAIALGELFGVYNFVWICFAIVVVTQNDLGTSVIKAFKRFIGTLIGVALGILLSHYLADVIHFYSFSVLVLLFFALYFMKKRYAISLFFITLVIASTFYLLAPKNISIEQFLLARLFDTLIGLFIGIAGEALILPRSYMNNLRGNLVALYRYTWFYVILLQQQKTNRNNLQQVFNYIEASITEIEKFIDMVKFEPLMLLRKRYKSFATLKYDLGIVKSALQRAESQTLQHDTLQWTQHFFDNMQNVYRYTEQEMVNLLEKNKQALQPLLTDAPKSDKVFLQAISLILNAYITVYSIPTWKLNFR